jgi:hypothetical protein
MQCEAEAGSSQRVVVRLLVFGVPKSRVQRAAGRKKFASGAGFTVCTAAEHAGRAFTACNSAGIVFKTLSALQVDD